MKITALEARRYALPLAPPFNAVWDPRPRHRFEETIVIVDSDGDLRGYAGGAPVPDLELLETLLVGCDLEDTDRVFAVCQSVDFHSGRNWTLEVAVWDLLARSRHQPLWELLGGERNSYPAYASCGEHISPQARAERALEWRDGGIRALKLRFGRGEWQEDLAVVEEVRAAVGDTMDIMIDANQGWRMPGDLTPSWDLNTATTCARDLSDLDVYWLEEPLPTESIDDYVRLRESTDLLIAGGEMVRTLAESRRLIEAGAFDVIQNDVVLAGGVSGARQVATWAGHAGLRWSPHTWTTGYGMLANLHVALAWSTGDFLEVPYDPPAWSPDRRDFMLPVPLELTTDGAIGPPEGDGLGVIPDLNALERWRIG